jgi:4-amino-4-deoxy-L-arabinose transferase-like glycosyltransferase
MLAALGLRLMRWEHTTVLFNDGPVFLALARAIAEGDLATALAHPFHPLYSASIAAVHLTLGTAFGMSWESSGVWASALAGAGAVAAMYGFVRGAFGEREGLLAAGLLALHSGAIDMSGDVQSEGLYLALFLAACGVLWVALRDADAQRAALAGLLSGLAYLVRPEGLGIAIVAAGLAAGAVVWRRWTPGRGIGWVLALALGAGICVLPYMGALYAQTGELWLTRKKSVSWVAGVDGPPAHFAGKQTVEPDWEAIALPSGMERPHAGSAEERPSFPEAKRGAAPEAEEPKPDTAEGGVLLALSDLVRTAGRALRYELLLLLLPGLWAVRGRPGLRAAFVASLIGAYGVVLVGLAMNVGYLSTRHALPPISLLLGYAACGIAPWARLLGRRRHRPLAWGTVAAAVLLVAAGIAIYRTSRSNDLDELAERRAAEWLRAEVGDAGPVAARKRRVAYYARAPFVQLRTKRPARMLHYLHSYDVRYVIVNEADLEGYDGLAPLMPHLLVRIHQEEAEGERAVVLRFLAPRELGGG